MGRERDADARENFCRRHNMRRAHTRPSLPEQSSAVQRSAVQCSAVQRSAAHLAAAGRRLPFEQRLVRPVPHEAALQPRPALERLPVLAQAAGRVAHRVRVLAQHDRARAAQQRRQVRLLLRLSRGGASRARLGRRGGGGRSGGVDGGGAKRGDRRLDGALRRRQRRELRQARVHRADHVRRGGARAAAFIVDGPRGVAAPQPRRHRVVRGAVAGLVAERPHQDAGMVLVALVHAVGVMVAVVVVVQ